jgi:hypothetical protein
VHRAKRWTRPSDPILVDLDGDGLETVGLASNVYFDHDGDGVLTKTGWALRTCRWPNRGRQQQRDYQQRRAARHQDAKFGDGKKTMPAWKSRWRQGSDRADLAWRVGQDGEK